MDGQINLGDRVSVADPEDVTIGELLALLQDHGSLPLMFSYDGRDLQPGYHVTEVKAGQFAALDCGGNPEAWTEIFVQLWDVNEDAGRVHMHAGLFVKIIGKVIEHVDLDRTAKLTFEVSDAVRPMQLFRAAAPIITSDRIQIALSPRPASCKPRDRWLEQHQSSCCAPRASGCC
ncbi:DUF6428 family protein [Pseudomonas sp. GX19020]|uniref:DUF6428 family protein n=1 Tax=Pseudomonas sp. GX19020 TaxID=2942277 RepID=UPI0020196E2F|nr:DUF6428 family protein [Pseudomonas sp. GX19020]MCL4067407.1 DUF6428 family protein [Pseudomonas sp. GX19020]